MYNNGFVTAIKINGKTVGEKDGKIIIPFNTEYSLMLKNRNGRKAVARVYIDGEEVTKTGRLILDANSSLNLERYVENMDNGNCFKFVHLDSAQIQDKNDSEKGYIEVRFQLVKPTQSQIIYHEEHIYHNHNHHHHHDHFHDYWDYPIYKGPFYLSDPIWYGEYTNGGALNATFNINSTGNNMNFTAVNSKQELKDLNIEVKNNLCSKEEPGATTKGSKSNQKFSYSYVGELEAQETVLRFKLVGTSDKNIVSQYLKPHCEQCSKKYETNDHFCSQCGTKR